MNLNNKQWLAIAIAVLAFLSGSAGQMTDIFGLTAAKQIASSASFLNGILGAIMAAIVGQASLVRDVAAMSPNEVVPELVKANKSAVITEVAKLPEVKTVELTKSPQAQVISDTTPDNVHIGAG